MTPAPGGRWTRWSDAPPESGSCVIERFTTLVHIELQQLNITDSHRITGQSVARMIQAIKTAMIST